VLITCVVYMTGSTGFKNNQISGNAEKIIGQRAVSALFKIAFIIPIDSLSRDWV